MIPLYEIWVGVGEPTMSPGFNGRSRWTPALYGDYSTMQLPLAWARDYVFGLSKKLKCPTEVRCKNHKIKVSFAYSA